MQILTQSRLYKHAIFGLTVCVFLLSQSAQGQLAENNSTASASKQVTRHTPIYRDYTSVPIDPRKPCTACSRPADCKAKPKFDLPVCEVGLIWTITLEDAHVATNMPIVIRCPVGLGHNHSLLNAKILIRDSQHGWMILAALA